MQRSPIRERGRGARRRKSLEQGVDEGADGRKFSGYDLNAYLNQQNNYRS